MTGMITSIRGPLPVAEAPLTSSPVTRPQGSTGAVAPVAATALEQAVQHVPPISTANHPNLMPMRAAADESATAAAQAAREAYIKASIAAGINPLPVP